MYSIFIHKIVIRLSLESCQIIEIRFFICGATESLFSLAVLKFEFIQLILPIFSLILQENQLNCHQNTV